MENQTLELTLINALNKLRYADFDKEFLREKNQLEAELITEQHFAFTIGQHHFVVKASCFCEVFSGMPVAPLPNATSMLMGLCNIRSVLVPVYQLHTSLGYAQPSKANVFCIGKGDKTLGLWVDELPVSLDLSPREQVKQKPVDDGELLNTLTHQRYFSRQSLWHLLDGNLLGEQLLALASNAKPANFSVAQGLIPSA